MAVSVDRIKSIASWGFLGIGGDYTVTVVPILPGPPVAGEYGEIAADVLAALEEAGVEMTLGHVTPGTYDPATGDFTGSSTAYYSVTGLIQTQSLGTAGGVGQRFFNGILVQTDDEFVLLVASGLAVDPAPGDLLIITGVTYSIVTMIPVRPGGVDLMYRVLARK